MISKEKLRRAWLDRHCHLSPTQETLRHAAFSLIRVGRVASENLLASQTGFSSDVVRHELTALEAQGLIVRERRGVVGIFGLSLVQTPQALCLDAHPLHTWCALDAVGIPAGLAADATVRAPCVLCQQDLVIELRAGRLTQMSAAALSLWLTLPGQGASFMDDT